MKSGTKFLSAAMEAKLKLRHFLTLKLQHYPETLSI